MKKRQIAGILALALALLAAAGCGKQADAGGEPDLPPPAGTEIVSDEKVPKAETPGETGGAAFALTEEELLALPEDSADMYNYDEVDGKLRILNRNGDAEIVVIPSVIDGKEVTQIAGNVFSRETSMKAVVIPENVETLEENAFSACLDLEAVVFAGDKLTSVGKKAFNICSKLHSIKLPESVVFIGDGAFTSCRSLRELKIPDKVKTIESGAFFNTGIETVEIPDGVTEIGAATFALCVNLTVCKIPDSVLNIRNDAFGESPNVIIVASPDSYAAQFAAEKGIKFQEA